MLRYIFCFKFFLLIAVSAQSQTQSDTSDTYWEVVFSVPASQDVDMQQCLVGTNKDSVITYFIKNVGSWKFRVDSIYFTGADASAFSIVSGLPIYILEAGRNKATEFRFKPTEARKYEADIVIITQADTLYQKIYGEGVQPMLEIVNNLIDFGEVKVNTPRDSIQAVTIKNIGNSPLMIKSSNHNKPNDIDFTTQAGGGIFTLQPNDTCKMDLRFKPSDKGRTSGTLEFHYDGVGSPAIVQLFGTGIKTNPTIQANISSLDNITCETSSSKPLEIKNTGGDTLKITNIASNSTDFIINEATQINLAPDSSKTINITFKPTNTGLKAADIIIRSNADPDSIKTITVSARKDSVALVPELTVIDLGYLRPNEPKDTTLKINNTGTIKTGGRAELSGLITSNNSSFSINTSDFHSLNIHFTGKDTEGTINEKIIVYDEICGRSQEVLIIGTTSIPSATLQTIQISAYAGEIIEIPIILNNQENLSIANVNQIKVDLLFNPTLLFPLDYKVKPIDDYTARITLDKLPTNVPIGEAVAKVKFKTGLGNAEDCDLTLENESTIGGNAKLTLLHGKFTLLGICYEGGTRLINPNEQVKIHSVAPTPSSDKIKIDFSIIEKGETQLLLINALGEIVKSIAINTNSVGNKTEIISLDNVAQGQYLLVLKTPSHNINELIQVVK